MPRLPRYIRQTMTTCQQVNRTPLSDILTKNLIFYRVYEICLDYSDAIQRVENRWRHVSKQKMQIQWVELKYRPGGLGWPFWRRFAFVFSGCLWHTTEFCDKLDFAVVATPARWARPPTRSFFAVRRWRLLFRTGK